MTTIYPPRENVIPGQPPSAQEIQRKLSVAQRKASLSQLPHLLAPHLQPLRC
jgi:hypothetical protein